MAAVANLAFTQGEDEARGDDHRGHMVGVNKLFTSVLECGGGRPGDWG